MSASADTTRKAAASSPGISGWFNRRIAGRWRAPSSDASQSSITNGHEIATTDSSAAEGVTTLRLSGIGWLLQWRGDGFWRELSESQHAAELDGSHRPDEDEWVRWSGLSQPQARGGEWGGAVTWWLIYGEVPGRSTPTVVLADGSRPPVAVVGRLWACQWRAVAQPATVHVDGHQFDLPFAEPFYRRQRPEGDSPLPPTRGAEDAGWFDASSPETPRWQLCTLVVT